MAFVEQRGNRFRVIFRYGGRRFARTLKTTDPKEADALAGGVEKTLLRLEQGLLELPQGTDVLSFIMRDGKQTEKPKPPPIRTLAELRERYLQANANGAMEENSLDTVRMHLNHFVATLGANFAVQTLELTHLQQHVDRRAKEKGLYKRSISPVTLRKEIASFRACWNWGVQAGLVTGIFPNRGLKYPKVDEKPPFRSWEEIERQIARGGLTPERIKEAWDCLFLTASQIDEVLSFVETHARHGWLFPMICTAAHTGARRSELLRARIEDVDFEGRTIVLREKKRAKGRRTTRRVPLSPFLEKILSHWLHEHPGGQYLFCQKTHVERSKTRRSEPTPVTRDEAQDHFQRVFAESKWQVLRGWHTLRHSFISACAARGIDQRMIDEWSGHQTEEMRRRYRHLIPNQQQEALELVFGKGQ